MGIIFRKIGGRVIPIKISNVKDAVSQASSYGGVKYRNIIAKSKGEQIGKMSIQIDKNLKKATVLAVNVEKKFQKKGISKEMFKKATSFLERLGTRFLRSDDIQHIAQVKIRSKYGRYGKTFKNSKGTPLRKNRTKYVADQFGRYGEETRKISKQQAIDFIKQNKTENSTGRLVRATTMLKKRKK